MLSNAKVFPSFSTNNLDDAKKFYHDMLGFPIKEEHEGGAITFGGDNTDIIVYLKEDHKPATFTILNFVVKDIEETMNEMKEKGIEFEMYDGMGQDESGVSAGEKAKMAWFTDLSGNIHGLIQML